MAITVSNNLRTVIDEKWHARALSPNYTHEIALWCFKRMGYPLGQLDPRTFDYNHRWHIVEPPRSSLVTPASWIAFKHEQDLTMYLLRWGDANE